MEIPEGQRQALHAIALKKGLRGYSRIIQEAVAFYIQNKEELNAARMQLLQLKGSWSPTHTRRVRQRIDQVRGNWKISS